MNESTHVPILNNKVTQGTMPNLSGTEKFSGKKLPVNKGNLVKADRPLDTLPKEITEPKINRPEFRTHDDYFLLNGRKQRPGLYYHTQSKPKGDAEPEPIDEWICTPIHADAIMADARSESYGLLLRFMNPDGKWKEWAAPMRLLKGSAEELRGELLNMGVRINPQKRNLLSQWMMNSYPTDHIIAALRTGWHDESFVLPKKIIGDQNIRFQSEHTAHNNFMTSGTLNGWQKSIAELCKENPLLLLTASAAFAGPLLKVAKLQETGGAGIHLIGDSSLGKTTALQVAGSVWGPPEFVRTWRATSNGLEATAAAQNDTLLILDEISECDPKEIGTIVYALANGSGKQRASRTGGARQSANWRIIAISSGERSLSAHMSEGGKRVKAGQQARLLDLPATTRKHGLFDCLHSSTDGRAFADTLKQATGQNYGHAGPAFIEYLINDERDLPELYAKFCLIPDFQGSDGVENRAANIFALVGLAGELAAEYGITTWDEGEALKAAILGYKSWKEFRGQGQTETRQILNSISNFILRNGDSRFSPINKYDISIRDRAGYWRDTPEGRIYFFNSPSLQEAAPGFDIRRILTALDSEKWIAEHDIDKRSKKIKIAGSPKSLYAIRSKKGDEL